MDKKIEYFICVLNSDELTKLLLQQIQHWPSHELHVKWIRRIMKVNPQNLISDVWSLGEIPPNELTADPSQDHLPWFQSSVHTDD